MEEPSPHSSRIALAGGLAAAIILGGAGFLLGRSTGEPETVVVTKTAPPTPVADTALPAVLGRGDLLKIAADASDTLASGRGAESGPDQIDGKRFEVRMPFGCNGPAEESSGLAMRWRYDEASAVLRLHVAPVNWTAQDWAISGPVEGMATASPTIENIEGFWIDRPWTSSENCPAAATYPEPGNTEPVTSPDRSLAIGQVFAPEEGTRADQRKGKPYTTVMRVPAETLNTSQGFRLRLTGRITRLPTGSVVHCQQAAGSGQRPACLVGAQFDEVAIENPATGTVVATWRAGRR